ncbi:MAG: metallophosphatase [Capsulimonas sp.]|nr:metallophosphatase [Capsulimonas sp.]
MRASDPMIYAIGDVHGEAEALRTLLAKLPLEPTDLVIFLGDLINRQGRNPFDCIEQVIQFDRCRKVCLQGNHEEAMMMFLESGDMSIMTGMGGQTTLDSYEAAGYPIRPGDPQSIPESHARFYFQAEAWTLPFYITDDYIFTHAGWDLAQPLARQVPARWRWERVTGVEKRVWTQTVIRGHTPMPKVTHATSKGYIGIDTGCGMGGFLSAIALPSEKTYSARPASFKPVWFVAMRQR